MNKSTRTALIISIIYGVGLVGMYGYGISVVQSKGQELANTRDMLVEQTAKEAAYNNILRLIADTEPDRLELQTFFLTERETISFITETEQIAQQLGLEFQTTELSITEATTDTQAELQASFRFIGSEASVKYFLEILEYVPYHKTIPRVSVTSQAGADNWRADVSLRITILP